MAAVTLLGRGAELLTFRRALDAAVGGRTSALLVAGEAGIGKTRLLEEFERLAGSRAIPVLWGRAAGDAGAPAFWPWRQVLRSWLTTTDDADAQGLVGDAYVDLTRIAPELAAVCGAGEHVEPAALDAEDRFALFETVAGFLGQAAATRALVVLLDDLHWADTASLLLLAHVVRYLRESRLLLVAAFRPVEITHTSQGGEVLAVLAAQPRADRVDLAGLSAEDIGRQLCLVMGRPASEETVATVARRTAGNPLFVQEVGRLLAEGADGVPAAVRAAFGRRLTYLPTSQRAVLASAAVVSAVIDPGLLSVVTGVDIDIVMEALEAAVPLGLVDRASGAVGFRFVHDLVRECCALDASAAEQRRIHLAVAVHLEGTQPGQHLAEIAHHRMAALPLGDPHLASDAAAEAAVHALGLLAYEDAARLYRWALNAAAFAGAEPGRRARLLVDAARAHHLANDGSASKSMCEQAAALAQQVGDAEALARAALVREDTTDPEWLAEVVAWCRAALAGLGEGDSRLRAQVLAQQAMAHLFLSEPSRIGPVSAAALAMAERVGEPAALATAFRARQLALSSPDGAEERLALAGRMAALAERTGDARALLWGWLWRYDALMQLGQVDEAEDVVGRLDAVVTRCRLPLARWHLLRSVTAIHLARGRFAAGLATNDEALDVGATIGDLGAVMATVTTKTWVSVLTGTDLVAAAEFDVPEPPPAFAGAVHAFRAEYDLAFGRRDLALRHYQHLPPPSHSWLPFLQLSGEAMRAVLAAAFGDRAGARGAYDNLLPHAERHATTGAGVFTTRGSVRHHLGVAAAACGRLDDAVAHFQAAVDVNTTAGLPPAAAESRVCLAETLLQRGGQGDADTPADAAAEGARAATSLGMRPLAARAAAVIDTLRPRRAPADPLSPREHEVAALVTQGLTNRQIAERLHIAERTAENHVQHILTKLDFNTRSQVAAWFSRLDATRSQR